MNDNTERNLPMELGVKNSLVGDKKLYRNLGMLIFKVIILCGSSFYFGYCLTYLSTIDAQIMTNYFGLGKNQN